MSHAYEFIAGKLYDNLGYCWFASGDFCTFVHLTPCTASIANSMDGEGWVIYTQPVTHMSMHYKVGQVTYLVTYVKKERTRS